MPGKGRNGVFLSYARKDGEEFAARLRDRLTLEAPDIPINQDRLLLEGGVGWWKQITDAIDSVEFLILVMTPAAMESSLVRKEWRFARQQGVCVYPVKGAPETGLRFADLPRWMSKSHFFDIDKEWHVFVAHLRKGCDTPRVPFTPPDLPETFVDRPRQFEQLKGLLLQPDRSGPVAITTALSGAGGFGKTTLATALCHDEDLILNFDDGILWVTLGQQPDVLRKLTTLYAAFTGERPGFADEEDAASQVAQLLGDRNCLIVIDDVWDAAHLRPFLRGGAGCARLITTRDSEIAAKAKSVVVDEMTSGESVALLTSGIIGLDLSQAAELARRLGEWPLALELARATMGQRIERGDSAEGALHHVLRALEKRGVGALRNSTAEPRYRTIETVIGASLELLGHEERSRFCELAIFPEDVSIPLTAVSCLWRLEEWETEDTAQALAQLSLIKLDLQSGTLRLHDVMRKWLADKLQNAAKLHSRLVDAWEDWHHLPDAYAWRWLTWHLDQAGRKKDLRTTLWNAAWLEGKVEASGTEEVIRDFDHLDFAEGKDAIQGALRLSTHILARDTTQLVPQLVGRLLSFDIPEFWEMVRQYGRRSCWLRPLHPALTAPGQALLRTIVGHSRWVTAVVVCANGKHAISGSDDQTLKVWDLASGAEVRTLIGHADMVNAVAVCGGGKQAISASDDKFLKVWNLETGAEARTISGHTDAVTAVAVCGDHKKAISGSWDQTLKVWDLESGLEIRSFSGHNASVTAVAICGNSQRVVSSSADGTLKVWDFETGVELHTLTGHSKRVTSLAVYADGERAVSASWDQTLKVVGSGYRHPDSHAHRAYRCGYCRGGSGGREPGRIGILGPNSQGMGLGYGCPDHDPQGARRLSHRRGRVCRRQARHFGVLGPDIESVGPCGKSPGPRRYRTWR